MTCYSVLEVTPTDDAWIAGYLEPVAAIIAKHGVNRPGNVACSDP